VDVRPTVRSWTHFFYSVRGFTVREGGHVDAIMRSLKWVEGRWHWTASQWALVYRGRKLHGLVQILDCHGSRRQSGWNDLDEDQRALTESKYPVFWILGGVIRFSPPVSLTEIDIGKQRLRGLWYFRKLTEKCPDALNRVKQQIRTAISNISRLR
jgi:hypothetical protein